MTVVDSRLALHGAVRNLWLAVAELVLSANDDQPEEGDLASAEQVAQLALEIQGRLAQALAELSVTSRVSASDAMCELWDVERLLREVGLLYWRDLRAHGPISQLRGSTRRRGGAWPSWWFGVEQSLERCEGPLVAAGQAVGTAWHELITAAPSKHPGRTSPGGRRDER